MTYATGYLRRSKDAVVGAVQNNLMVQFTLVCLLLTIVTASSLALVQSRIARSALISPDTAMVKLWSTEGTVIYSDDPTAVGDRFAEKSGVLAALSGEIATIIVNGGGIMYHQGGQTLRCGV